MLTVIDIINRVLGYFNIADKPKGKAFTWIAFVANFYLLYIAIQNLRYPDFRIRGALFMLAFVVFLYFIALNFLYYLQIRQPGLIFRRQLRSGWAVIRLRKLLPKTN